MTHDEPDDNGDEDSVRSASTAEQLSFWSLTVAFMLTLIALGITVFIVPYNQWIVLSRLDSDSEDHFTFIRGIAGSDCAWRPAAGHSIDCIRWSATEALLFDENEDPAVSAAFWTEKGVHVRDVRLPNNVYRSLYYVLLLQILIYVVDLGVVFAMCCRYRVPDAQKHTEKRFAVFGFLLIELSHVYIVLVVAYNRRNFLGGHYEACVGNAFRLLFGAHLLFVGASAFVFVTEFYRRSAREAAETVPQRIARPLRELFTADRKAADGYTSGVQMP